MLPWHHLGGILSVNSWLFVVDILKYTIDNLVKKRYSGLQGCFTCNLDNSFCFTVPSTPPPDMTETLGSRELAPVLVLTAGDDACLSGRWIKKMSQSLIAVGITYFVCWWSAVLLDALAVVCFATLQNRQDIQESVFTEYSKYVTLCVSPCQYARGLPMTIISKWPTLTAADVTWDDFNVSFTSPPSLPSLFLPLSPFHFDIVWYPFSAAVSPVLVLLHVLHLDKVFKQTTARFGDLLP